MITQTHTNTHKHTETKSTYTQVDKNRTSVYTYMLTGKKVDENKTHKEN